MRPHTTTIFRFAQEENTTIAKLYFKMLNHYQKKVLPVQNENVSPHLRFRCDIDLFYQTTKMYFENTIR